MGFRPPRKQPQFADLKGILAQTRQTENPLYQTVQVMIERLTQFQSVTLDRIAEVEEELEELAGQVGEGDEGLGDHYDSPLSDGDLVAADLIYAAGECIIVQVPV